MSGKDGTTIEVVCEFADLERYRASWNDLAYRAGTSTVFQTYEWHETWCRVFGDAAQPRVLLAHRRKMLVAIAPLMLSHRRVLGRMQRVLEFVGTRMSDYCDFIVARSDVDVLPLFFSKLSELGFDLLHLRDIPEGSQTLAAISAHFDDQHIDIRPLYEAPAWRFGNREADRRLPQKKSLRRHFNHFDRSGRLEFKAHVPLSEMEEYLDRLFAQHIARWDLRGTPSVFRDKRYRDFFYQLAAALAPTGWLLFSAVMFEGKPIALHFGFEYGGRIVWYKPSFDVEHARHSPGEVLLKYLLEYAMERNATQFDFTIGEDGYKYRFANRAPINYAIRVVRRRHELWAMRALLKVKARVEQSTLLARVSQRLFSGWRDHWWL